MSSYLSPLARCTASRNYSMISCMRSRFRRRIGILLTVAGTPLAGSRLQAGIAVVDITPPIPFRMSGYFYERLSTGTKDPLQAKAIVFQQGDESAALVFCDLIGVPLTVIYRARRQASEATGIPVDHIAVAATHSHTGPLFLRRLRDYFHARSVEQTATIRTKWSTIPPTCDEDRRRSRRGEDAAATGRVEIGYAEKRAGVQSPLPHERRLGAIQSGRANPDIVRPAGPIDPQVGIILLTKPGAASRLAAIVSFAMHLDTMGGTEYSADYPKIARIGCDRASAPNSRCYSAPAPAATSTTSTCPQRSSAKRRNRPMLGDTVAEAIEQGELVARHASRRSACERQSRRAAAIVLGRANCRCPQESGPASARASCRFSSKSKPTKSSTCRLKRANPCRSKCRPFA